MLQRLAKKKVLLLSALMVSGLVSAEESLPDVVKHFSEQQDIKIIKKIDARRRASVAGAISGHGRDALSDP